MINRGPSSRFRFNGDDRLLKTIAVLMITLRGTPFLYHGEEIGMRDIQLSRAEIMDPPGRSTGRSTKAGMAAAARCNGMTRSTAGFSDFKPWLPVHPGYVQRNVDVTDERPCILIEFL